MRNKKGLSTVVTTLIIILLVLVAVGIIWGVVNNLLNKSKGTIEASTECFDLDMSAVSVTNNTSPAANATNFTIALKRSAGGTSDSIYAKVVLSNSGGASDVLDFTDGLAPLAQKSFVKDTTITCPTKAEVTAYYLDDAGDEKLCPITTEFDFTIKGC